MPNGLIVKSLSGFYYVQDQDLYIQCRGRGLFRKQKRKPLVGDYVEYEAENKTDGYIMELLERKNELIRPSIANVDQALLVFSALEPDFSTHLLDRFLVHIEAAQIEPVIIISKMDLLTTKQEEEIQTYKEHYQDIGYRVRLTSNVAEQGVQWLLPDLNDRMSVVAGQSGVGKSSLLNALKPNLDIETDKISTHLGRGKHTTRHVELLSIGSGLVADTPGFSSVEFTDIEAEDLALYFPEMASRMPDCKFRGCLHTSEPKCAVKVAVEEGQIQSYRYEHYLTFLEEINQRKRRY
ncbi:ribosome small subunit-dependent GTPase A [Alkalicoccobacillus plakortidis]|uniref:Small ribosomal subunit biogenesis GTPase RsgA n=1 Tax=Alkalicoccobacillus plakortidis TaxID=444060 RepID=A0ABT0XFW3_9BACI|nr:ribosome small subunit-dependent GTPase A [Alkalicoccobacillus plakortidis]MCM2674783.1 ribosome small subunit-dependent GTPase A [Alkalicoccobacillus plakortidis]